MYTDRIDLSIPQEDIVSVLADIASATATLEFLPFVNPSDRKHLAKLGLKNEGLARRIIELGRAHPGLLPRDLDFEKVDRDLLARDQLWELKLVLEKLMGRVSDALMLTGVDLYAAALEMYHCLRRHDDHPGLRDFIDDVKRGFSRPSRKRKQEEQRVSPNPIPAGDSDSKVFRQDSGGSVPADQRCDAATLDGADVRTDKPSRPYEPGVFSGKPVPGAATGAPDYHAPLPSCSQQSQIPGAPALFLFPVTDSDLPLGRIYTGISGATCTLNGEVILTRPQ